MAIEDFGEKIGGARKDLWIQRGLTINDIANFNKAEKDKYIKKNNIWIKPDYEKLLNEEGYSRDAVYYIKCLRDAILTAPDILKLDKEDVIKQKQENYIEFVNAIKSEAMKIKTNDDIDKFGLSYLIRTGYIEKDRYLYCVTEKGHGCISNKLSKVLQMSSYTVSREASRKDFLGDQEKVIRDSFKIAVIDGEKLKLSERHWGSSYEVCLEMKVPGGTSYLYPYIKDIDSKDMYNIGDTIVYRGNNIICVGDEQYAREVMESTINSLVKKKEEVKEVKKEDSKQRKTALKPPILEHIIRKGPEEIDRNVVGQDFLDTFNIKGGEFGNWLNEKERQVNMNMAFESFRDLARILNINDSDIALGGKLNIAFGSRGVKYAAAHYEPDREVINLTKMNGAGSLAHELFHAFDDLAGKKMELGKFATECRTNNAFFELMQLIKYKERELSVIEQQQQFRDDAHRQTENLMQEILKMVPDSILSPEKIVERDDLFKELIAKTKDSEHQFLTYDFSKRTPKEIISNEIDKMALFINENAKFYKMNDRNRKWLASRLNSIASCEAVIDTIDKPKVVKEATTFYKNAQELDAVYCKTNHGYWQSNVELAARAFACYVADKLQENGIRNDYLVGHAFQKAGNIPVYPSKEERQVLNKAFDNVIQEMKTLDIFHDRDERSLEVKVPDVPVDNIEPSTKYEQLSIADWMENTDTIRGESENIEVATPEDMKMFDELIGRFKEKEVVKNERRTI